MFAGHHAFFVVLPFLRVDADGGWSFLFDVGGHGVFVLVIAFAFATLGRGECVSGNFSTSDFEMLASAIVPCAVAGVLVLRFTGHAARFHDVFVGRESISAIAFEIILVATDNLLRLNLMGS